uniref:hypothetical protein n=1 Tax=Blautia obeum TaxID=40520 RepID=UPI003566C2B7
MAAVKLPKAVRIVRAAKKQDVQNPMSEDLHWKRKKLEVQGPVCVMSRSTEAVKQPVPKLSETEKRADPENKIFPYSILREELYLQFCS